MSNATATPDAALLAAFDPNATLGALQVGCLLSTFLFGIVTVQTFMYYQTAPNDRSVLKILVAVVWWLELGHTICVCHTLYITTITDYGHPERLVKTPISLSVSILFSGIVGPLVQSFFAYRMWVIAGSPYLPICCWSLSGLRFIGSVIAAAEAFRMKSLSQYESQWQWLLTAILAVGAANDVIIASSLSYALNRQRNTVMRETVALVDKLVLYTIQTGLLTSLAAVTMLICFLTMKRNFVWLAIFMFLAKLFSNSLLASLNARVQLRKMQRGKTITFSSLWTGYGSNTIHSGPKFAPNPVNIEMTEVTETEYSANYMMMKPCPMENLESDAVHVGDQV